MATLKISRVGLVSAKVSLLGLVTISGGQCAIIGVGLRPTVALNRRHLGKRILHAGMGMENVQRGLS
jgi:hypothetical protein